MKSILHRIYCFLESMGRARAAGQLARAGQHEMARNIMMEKNTCC